MACLHQLRIVFHSHLQISSGAILTSVGWQTGQVLGQHPSSLLLNLEGGGGGGLRGKLTTGGLPRLAVCIPQRSVVRPEARQGCASGAEVEPPPPVFFLEKFLSEQRRVIPYYCSGGLLGGDWWLPPRGAPALSFTPKPQFQPPTHTPQPPQTGPHFHSLQMGLAKLDTAF